MMRLYHSSFLSAFRNIMTADSSNEPFLKDDVVPDVIDNPPDDLIIVKYGPSVVVNLGKELRPTDVKATPSAVSWKSDSPKFYALVLIDPDTPSRRFNFLREMNHWMIVNIPGDEIQKGDTMVNYFSPAPPPFGGLHRYVFLVYEQSGGKITFDESIIVNGITSFKRMKFSIRKFAEKYNLGPPIAGNYFQAQF